MPSVPNRRPPRRAAAQCHTAASFWTEGLGRNSGVGMVPHDSIVVDIADKAAFIAVVSASVVMILHAIRQVEFLPDQRPGQKAIEVDPLPAVARPGLATRSLPDSGLDQHPLKLDEVLASHRRAVERCGERRADFAPTFRLELGVLSPPVAQAGCTLPRYERRIANRRPSTRPSRSPALERLCQWRRPDLRSDGGETSLSCPRGPSDTLRNRMCRPRARRYRRNGLPPGC